jgi:hypothetical protein
VEAMTSELSHYLESIKYGSKLNPSEEGKVMSELEAHIMDKLQDLKDSGLTDTEAIQVCLGQMGATHIVARRIYEAYSQGTWQQVLLAAMPHLLFGVLFILNWWHYAGWLSLALVITLATAVYGWWHGKPAWVFSWLGYTLFPILILGMLLLYLPGVWSLLTLLIYLPLAMWWLIRIIVQTTRKDWLFSSMMLLPLPIIIGWFLAILPQGKLDEVNFQRLNYFAPWIGLSFIALALTIAAFLRIRQRALRIGLLAVSSLLTVTLVVYYAMGRLNTLTFVGFVLVIWSILLVPPILERFIGHPRDSSTDSTISKELEVN